MISQKQWERLPVETRRKALSLLLRKDVAEEAVAGAWALHAILIQKNVAAVEGGPYRAIVGTRCIR